MNPLQSVQSNRAKQFARKVDAATNTRGSKVKPPATRTDITAPTLLVDAVPGEEQVARKPLHVCGRVQVVNGKSHGTIATPRSYTVWLKAGCPPHPIYNAEAWKRERYVNGIALPTGGRPPVETSERHAVDCECIPCREYRKSVVVRTAQTDNQDFKPAGKPLIPTRDWVRQLYTDLKLSKLVDTVGESVSVPFKDMGMGVPVRPPLRTS